MVRNEKKRYSLINLCIHNYIKNEYFPASVYKKYFFIVISKLIFHSTKEWEKL